MYQQTALHSLPLYAVVVDGWMDGCGTILDPRITENLPNTGKWSIGTKNT